MSLRPVQLPRRSAIFVNYRREDSAGHAGRLFDRLSILFPSRVFMDIDTIEPGTDFVEVIEQAVGCCEVLIVMMGGQWLSLADASGRRRLDNPSDFVRLEIAEALNRNIRIIPVLVEGASMPRPEDLPPDLAKLTRRNAIELSDARWAFDVDRLIQTIEGVLQEKAPSALLPVVTAPSQPAPAQEAQERKMQERKRSRAGLVLSLLVLLALWIGWGLGRQVMSLRSQAPPMKPPQTIQVPEQKAEPAAPPEEKAAEKKVIRKPKEPKEIAAPQPDPESSKAGKGRINSMVQWGKSLLGKGRGRGREGG